MSLSPHIGDPRKIESLEFSYFWPSTIRQPFPTGVHNGEKWFAWTHRKCIDNALKACRPVRCYVHRAISGRVTPGFSQNGNRARRCCLSVGFLEDLQFPPPLSCDAAPFSPHFAVSSGFGFRVVMALIVPRRIMVITEAASKQIIPLILAVRQKCCTPVESLALNGDRASYVRSSFALIAPTLFGLERGKNLQVGGSLKYSAVYSSEVGGWEGGSTCAGRRLGVVGAEDGAHAELEDGLVATSAGGRRRRFAGSRQDVVDEEVRCPRHALEHAGLVVESRHRVRVHIRRICRLPPGY
ncbi:hypothetical protein PR048_012791 [Dryococelus australis]|uniref:Uncharacterized protein n=1 Tax=Dryococelus australis TaxID=614101 RepID=A0ABQ9HQD9_9NEOP|nr:hypothetical protein PR048_012791 [Dryococelus australis]